MANYTRDSKGRATSIIEANGTPDARTTTIAYHPTLNLPTTITKPGLTESRTYTAGNLTSSTLTDTTAFTVPYATNGRTHTTAYAWSSTGQLLSVDGPLPGASDSQAMAYDATGQLTTHTDELGHVTTVVTRNAHGQAGQGARCQSGRYRLYL